MDEKIFAVVYDWDDGEHNAIFVRGLKAAKKIAEIIADEYKHVVNVDICQTYFDVKSILQPDYVSSSLWSWERPS